MATLHHEFLPDGWRNGIYKIKTSALKAELEQIKKRYPDRNWVIGEKLAGYYIAEYVVE